MFYISNTAVIWLFNIWSHFLQNIPNRDVVGSSIISNKEPEIRAKTV
jgi:hypothetical protein